MNPILDTSCHENLRFIYRYVGRSKEMAKYRAAVIGSGYMGCRHIDGYSILPNVAVVGAASKSEDTAYRIGQEYSIPTYTDWRRLMEDVKPDLISVCAPTPMHLDIAKRALARGIHTLVEKPMTETLREAAELVEIADAASAKLMVAHTDLYDSGILKMLTAIQKGIIGEVRLCSYTKTGRDVSPGDERKGIVEREEGSEASRERVYNLLIHMTYIINKIAGSEPLEIRTKELSAKRYREKVHSVIEYKNGVESRILINGDRPGPLFKEVKAQGTLGSIAWQLEAGQVTIFVEKKDSGRRAAAAEPSSPFDNTVKYFVEFVDRDIHPYSDSRDGLLSMRTSYTIIDSYEG